MTDLLMVVIVTFAFIGVLHHIYMGRMDRQQVQIAAIKDIMDDHLRLLQDYKITIEKIRDRVDNLELRVPEKYNNE